MPGIAAARAKPAGFDRASELALIADVERVADRYRSYVNECVAPPIQGVRFASISLDDGFGAIVVDIPQGNARPHMSMAPAHQRYYRRVADGFVPMLHYEVEEMMRLKTSPELGLVLNFQREGIFGSNPKSFLAFGLKNESRATAKYPYVTLRPSLEGPRLAEFGLNGNGNGLWKRLTRGLPGETIFAAGADTVIHPSQAFLISRLEYLRDEDQRWGRYWALESLLCGQTVRIEFVFGCEDCPTKTEFVEFTKSNLMNHDLPMGWLQK